MEKFTFQLNGESREVEADQFTPLLWVLRDHLHMVGTKYGCGIGECGACTIHLDGVATRSCMLPMGKVGSHESTTREGLSKSGDHPLQKAWKEHDVPQCGYCQAGQIMTAAAMLSDGDKLSDKEIENGMRGNICRCSAYIKIKEAVKSVAN